jgi:hypothetical protein
MESTKRYLAYSYPLVIVAYAITIFSVGSLGAYFLKQSGLKLVGRLVGLIIILTLCSIYFRGNFSLSKIFHGEKINRFADQKQLGDWIKSQGIEVIMARTEGISFYSGAKMVYIPAAPPDVIVDFAKNWGVEYILSRPHESSWPYMKVMVDPNFKHKDLRLIHSFPDGSLVWRVSLTDAEKKENFRTGKPIEAFCRSNEWSKTDDPNLPICPDRNY